MIVDPLPEDLHAAAVALWEATGLTRPWNDAEADLRRALAGPSSTGLADVADGRLRATAMVGHDGHRGWLYYVSCAPEHRRRGAGRRIVQAAVDWLRLRSIAKLQLLVREDNTEVIPFYERLGFRVEPRTVMSRRLD